MKKPEKINSNVLNKAEDYPIQEVLLERSYMSGYNQACDDWEKYHKKKLKELEEQLAELSLENFYKT